MPPFWTELRRLEILDGDRIMAGRAAEFENMPPFEMVVSAAVVRDMLDGSR